MSIANPLHVRVYWPFQGGASNADPICYLCFMYVFVMLPCLFLAALWLLLGWYGLLCVVFSCVLVAFPCGVLGLVWCLVVSIPDLCLLLYFEKLDIFIKYLFNCVDIASINK